MAGADLQFWKRVKNSFYATLVFILITNPITYRFTNTIFKGMVTVLDNGIPTPSGYFLHVGLFFLTVLAIMMFPRD
jgi:hypothetical protein